MGELLGLDSDDRSPGGHAQIIDRVAGLKREVLVLQRDVAKLQGRRSEMLTQRSTQETELQRLHREVTELKATIRRKSASVANKELELEVLRCALEGQPLPPFNPTTLDDVGSGPTSAAATSAQQQTQQTQQTETGGVSSSFTHQSTTEASQQHSSTGSDSDDEAGDGSDSNKDDGEGDEGEPSEELLNSDEVARKIIKKLKKRIAEAETTSQEYEKQRAKLQRRIDKHQTALDKLEADSTLNQSGSAAGGVPLLPPEVQEQLDAKRAQLVKVEGKIAKLKAALGESEVAQQLHAELKKFGKRLAKGSDANAQLEAELAQLDKRATEGMRNLEAVKARLRESQAAVEAAKAKLADATKKAAAERTAKDKELAAVQERTRRDLERVAEFEKELARLVAMQAEADQQ